MKIRIKEIEDIIKMISEPDFAEKLFDTPGASLDLNSLTVAGHSFGAITALSVAVKKLVKAAIIFDPWYLLTHREIDDKKFFLDKDGPHTLIIRTERFHDEIAVDVGDYYS
jgi:predicted esterase